MKSELEDIKKIIVSPKYSGEIEYGDRFHVGRANKHINLNLRVEKEE